MQCGADNAAGSAGAAQSHTAQQHALWRHHQHGHHGDAGQQQRQQQRGRGERSVCGYGALGPGECMVTCLCFSRLMMTTLSFTSRLRDLLPKNGDLIPISYRQSDP